MSVRFMLRHADRVLMLEDGTEVVVGRAADCALCLDDLMVSRRHATFRTRPDGAYVEDLGSRNGILVNGVASPGETRLRHGDRITVGSHVIQLLDANRDRHKTVPRMPRSDETVPTAPVSPYSTATTQTSRDVFGMLFDVADKALAGGRLPDAQSAVEYLANGLAEALAKGKTVDEATLQRASGYLLRIAEATREALWIDRLCEIYGLAEKVPPTEAIESIGTLLPRLRGMTANGLRTYVGKMSHRPLSPADRMRLKRLELLAG